MMSDRRPRFVLIADDDLDTVPDVLLIDYVLPDVDGLAIAERLKADPRTAGICILMVTGYATPDLQERALAAGIERVLLKPCLPQTLMREVVRALGRPPYRKGPPGNDPRVAT